ncbi:hypothetical protein [Bacillus sp. FJAT-45066]|uniref:hypothetical protein n=1 Tax=Bacillus sp. FJAT-45066 TaxID=2011010 RepID=UPI000BB84CA4|nr:hypothetical protein [Bacillus sp. FJAT-45066]
MEFQFRCKGNAIGCEITLDHENNKFMVRKEDTSGEVFNNADEMKDWVAENWTKSFFEDENDYEKLMKFISNNNDS